MDSQVTRPAPSLKQILGTAMLAFFSVVGVVAWLLTSQPPAATQRGSDTVSAAAFARVREGMQKAEVSAVIGVPERTILSLAEGYAWPEPEVACWYYTAVEVGREYQVCFIASEVVTRGSYLVSEGEVP